jgi:hypothetical protein
VTPVGVTGFRVPGERFRRPSVKVCGLAVGRDQAADLRQAAAAIEKALEDNSYACTGYQLKGENGCARTCRCSQG